MISLAALLRIGALRGGLTAAVLLGAAILAAVTLVKTVPDRTLSASLLALGLLLAGIALDRAVSATSRGAKAGGADTDSCEARPYWAAPAHASARVSPRVLALLGGPPELIGKGNAALTSVGWPPQRFAGTRLVRLACLSVRRGRLHVRWFGGRWQLGATDIEDVAWSWGGVIIRSRDGARWLLPALRSSRPVTCSAAAPRRALRLIEGWLTRARRGSRVAQRIRDALGLPAELTVDTFVDARARMG